MDKPLTKWYCDVCGEAIEDVKKGYVTWGRDSDSKACGFKIIHQQVCDDGNDPSSAALSDYLGNDGLAYLLSKLSLGPIKGALSSDSYCCVGDTDEFVDFMRRVQTPFYEEARRYFANRNVLDHFYDSNEVAPYLPKILQRIIELGQEESE